MGMSAAETRAALIDPKIKANGWSEDRIEREYLYRKGRIRLIGVAPSSARNPTLSVCRH